jgi:hypothetical protein
MHTALLADDCAFLSSSDLLLSYFLQLTVRFFQATTTTSGRMRLCRAEMSSPPPLYCIILSCALPTMLARLQGGLPHCPACNGHHLSHYLPRWQLYLTYM